MERDGVAAGARAALEVLRAAEPFDAPTLEARAGRRGRAPRGEAARRLPADSGRDHGHDRLARDLRIARGVRPRATVERVEAAISTLRAASGERSRAKQARPAADLRGERACVRARSRGADHEPERVKPPRARRATKGERRRGLGGRRFADAFDAVTGMPALSRHGGGCSGSASAGAVRGRCRRGDRGRYGARDRGHAGREQRRRPVRAYRRCPRGRGGVGAEGMRSLVDRLETYDVLSSRAGLAAPRALPPSRRRRADRRRADRRARPLAQPRRARGRRPAPRRRQAGHGGAVRRRAGGRARSESPRSGRVASAGTSGSTTRSSARCSSVAGGCRRSSLGGRAPSRRRRHGTRRRDPAR